ncbi:MAG TPA: hydroxylamine reductase [Candidatus Omnitrophota bacterium]|nr:hydroxylamine reductase [Candidatus Omnitrophota bacterium]HPS19753.1 hydroxylamine reductase [Candidatus Omnitrophota bacterium]
MFCRQCEQTAGGKGCTVKGVCGKEEPIAVLQDLLLYSLKGLAVYGKMARDLGASDKEVDRFVEEALFTTITNVNFDAVRIEAMIKKSYVMKERIRSLFDKAYAAKNKKDFTEQLPAAASWKNSDSQAGLIEQGRHVGILANPELNEDIRSLREILLLGMKGMAAYADHAAILGEEVEDVKAFFHKGLSALLDDKLSADDMVSLIMEFGMVNLKCMEALDRGNTRSFGNPVPTKVFLGAQKGPAILISGHDLLDLKQLLEQTEGKGINIYTHGEMLPAHGYPELKKHKHFVGHFGSAWQEQQKEFPAFPGAILMTTNCIQKPQESYNDRIFTTGLVAWPGVKHISAMGNKKDFSVVINKALECGGFKEDIPGKEILVGFGHNTVLGVADKVIDAVKTGKIKHFFLIGGCDGAKTGRNYYTDFSQKVPKDCVILTLACGKFRFNRLEFGDIGGIPRLLDCGQCNDAYSAIMIASALAKAFNCSVNELPLSLILSWYEQKAVCILLTLFALGIKDIRLGPTLPAFVSPNVLKVLIDKFAVKPITTVDEDLKQALAGK